MKSCGPDPNELFGVTHYLVRVEGAPDATVQAWIGSSTSGTTAAVLDDAGVGYVDLRPNAVQILFDAEVTFQYTLGELAGPLTEPVRLSGLPNQTGSICSIILLGGPAALAADGPAASAGETPTEQSTSDADGPAQVTPEPVVPVADPVAPVDEPVAPADEPVVPVEEPTSPSEDPAAPTEEPVAPVEVPQLPTDPVVPTTPLPPIADPISPVEDPPAPAPDDPADDDPAPDELVPADAPPVPPAEPIPRAISDPTEMAATQEQGLIDAALDTVGDVLGGALAPDQAATPAE